MQLYPNKKLDVPRGTNASTVRSGFGENYQAAVGLAMTEDLPVLSRMIPSETFHQRDRLLHGYIEDGTIPADIAAFYDHDPDRLAHYARNNLGLSDIPTMDEFNKQKDIEYEGYRTMSADVFSRQTKMGFIGEMAGNLNAYAIDPLYATSFLTGYGTAATIGQAALRVGAIEMGIETVAQIPKMRWKEEVGAHYSGADAVTQVVFAGLGGAGMAALTKSIGKAVTKGVAKYEYNKLINNTKLKIKHGLKVLQKMAKDNPEIDPIVHVLKQYDPEANLKATLQADEAIDIKQANQGPKKGADPKGDVDIDDPSFEAKMEESFYRRTQISPEETKLRAELHAEDDAVEAAKKAKKAKKTKQDTDEGVPRGTPKKDLGEYDAAVYTIDDNLKIMEDCF